MPPPNEASVKNALASSATGTTFLILIQLASRIFTFASNQLVLRALSPVLLGIAAQLELYQVSILFFSRESIRMAIQRQPLEGDSSSTSDKSSNQSAQSVSSQSVVNVSYLSLFLGVPCAIFFTLFYDRLAPVQALETPFFKITVAISGLASLMELSTEPFFGVVQQHMWYEKRAAVEMPAAFVKSLTTCSAFIYAFRTNWEAGALPFALGQLSYSIALFLGYCMSLLGRAKDNRFSFLPARIRSSKPSLYRLGRFSRDLTSLAASVFFQSMVKHLLTQGDSMILAAMSSLEDQGIYALASNYGGLIARIIFQPLEESSRTLFSALLSPDDSGKSSMSHTRAAKVHLLEILRAYQLLSAFIFPLGPLLVPEILGILGGPRWASTKVGDLLCLYCYYIPFLAFNGITEAFVSSAANPREIRRQTLWMGAFSACYALAAYLFLDVWSMGAYGLVLVNIVNMAVRTSWSYLFIRSYLRLHQEDLRIGEICIQPASYILGAIATGMTIAKKRSETSFGIISATAISGAYALLVLYVERQYIMGHLARLRQVVERRTKGFKSE